jgi:L-fucose mutarotase
VGVASLAWPDPNTCLFCIMVILKNIPRIFSPQLLSVLARMGHGDELVFADANFPSASVCKHGPELVRADGA